MKPLQHELLITIYVLLGPSLTAMPEEPIITSTLLLNATSVATVKKDPSNIFAIQDNISHYQQELPILSDLNAKVESSQKDKSDYA
jgi:hypothetical protein